MKSPATSATFAVLVFLQLASAQNVLNFDYEAHQLTGSEIAANPALSFGDVEAAKETVHQEVETNSLLTPKCKTQPGDPDWPSLEEWTSLNKSLGGVLLKPTPPGAACYPLQADYDEKQCEFLVEDADDTRFWIDNPVSIHTQWAQGNTCPAVRNPSRKCTQGGSPEYVVNATTVKHVQMAVNFARNKNIRLVVKNSGHDFLGRSTGAVSLSIWIHNMKSLEIIDSYTIGEYAGKAVKLAGGSEGFESLNVMNKSDLAWVAPGQTTLGHLGGWMQGGGHSALAGTYGLGSDQILSLNVVTADGRFVTADVNQNTDLFFALRGGGGGTFGVVTSGILKTYPGPVVSTGLAFSFTVGPIQANASIYPMFTTYPSTVISDIETFWGAYHAYLKHVELSSALGGFGFGDITPQGNRSYTLAGIFNMPKMSVSETETFLKPLFDRFWELGIEIEMPRVEERMYATISASTGTGMKPNEAYFASRLIPSWLWDDEESLQNFTDTVRYIVEEGQFQVRSRAYTPSLKAAGYPTTEVPSAVNPSLRDAYMHVTVFPKSDEDLMTVESSADQWAAKHERLTDYMAPLRELTVGSGAYANEADVGEPDWQFSFWGPIYRNLLAIKRNRDPWGLFWVQKGVGSEMWKVADPSLMESQDGVLCRNLASLGVPDT